MSELKVGDVVSVCIDGDWLAMRIKTKFDIPAISANTPQLGLHESLIPEGFAIVPIEPTDAMQNAARDWSIATLGNAVGGSGSSGCYQAMINAAPKPTDK